MGFTEAGGRERLPVGEDVGATGTGGAPLRAAASSTTRVGPVPLAVASGSTDELVAFGVGAAALSAKVPVIAEGVLREALVPLVSLPVLPMPMPTPTAMTTAATSRGSVGRRPRRFDASSPEIATAAPPGSLRASEERSPEADAAPSTVDARTNEGRACASSSTEIGPAGTLGIGVEATPGSSTDL